MNKTWAILPFEGVRLEISDDWGCVNFFADDTCKKFIANNCLDNSTHGPANVTLDDTKNSGGWIHYNMSCYCFETYIGPCKSTDDFLE
jgi:hypothetical protein